LLGFGGPAISLRIPGIPFAQEQDAGLHISLYNQPKQEGVHYTPPDTEACAALDGESFTITLDGGLKILNGGEANDLKVGGCYYVSLACGRNATEIANEVKAKVGLPYDETQEFHLSVATIAPSWCPVHPKSAAAMAAGDQESRWADSYRIFRHGDSAGFSGFNDDETTGWSTYFARVVDAGKKNDKIKAKIAELARTDDYESRKSLLQKQLIDTRTFGFCSPVGKKERLCGIRQPDACAQGRVACQLFAALMEPVAGAPKLTRSVTSTVCPEPMESPPSLTRGISAPIPLSIPIPCH